jgi:hypothetical protein
LAIEGGGCSGRIPSDHLHRAMLETSNGAQILQKLDERLAEHCLLKAQVSLVRCPFCGYAEVDNVYLPPREAVLRFRADSLGHIFVVVICLWTIPFLCSVFILTSLVCFLLRMNETVGDRIKKEWQEAKSRHHRRRRGMRFTCQRPSCKKPSCLACSKPWVDVHVCNESSLVSLRTQVEQAMSMAVKRVCPRCNTSFVKNAGCNKLVCPCGYIMCYVCRKDIGTEGYRHFCPHFRPEGDGRRCPECKNCNLWEADDTDALLKQAKEEAERKWKDAERRELTGSERAFLDTGFAAGKDYASLERLFSRGELPKMSDIFDVVIETLLI